MVREGGRMMSAILPILAYTARVKANISTTVPTIAVERFNNITDSWGGYNATNSSVPNFGSMILSIVSVYPDAVGQLAWVILFALPFIMMWITNADMVPAGVIGIFFGVYIFAFIGSQYGYVAVAFLINRVVNVAKEGLK
jgi:hypothetical protein